MPRGEFVARRDEARNKSACISANQINRSWPSQIAFADAVQVAASRNRSAGSKCQRTVMMPLDEFLASVMKPETNVRAFLQIKSIAPGQKNAFCDVVQVAASCNHSAL